MMNAFFGSFLLICLMTLMAGPAQGDPRCSSVGKTAEVKAIKLQRQAFNKAIADKDIDGVAGVLDDRVILITGTDSDLYTGAMAQIKLWSKDFANPNRAIYVRTSACIRVSPILPIALEYGSWRGQRVATSGDFAAGSYSAKWRKSKEGWLLESEIFATEECGGNFCPEE
jgi:ketosteroid isomerase-like protein